MSILTTLHSLRAASGPARTTGLPDATLTAFANNATLQQVVAEAATAHAALRAAYPDVMALPEPDQIIALQAGILNFYATDGVNPYVAIAARGPWLVTSCGAVLHDNGGYGMLGLGHAPPVILEAMARPQVMANIMSATFSQKRFTDALRAEIGHGRGGCPYSHFLFMNSGSEALSVGARLCDVHTRMATDPGARHAGKPVRLLSLKGGFHGRTQRPAQFSDSSRTNYLKHLASFREDLLWTVVPNDVAGLHTAFERADAEGVFLEAMFMEPVMGEGNPGLAIEPAFYDAARHLTEDHGTLLLVDSIQAGLRATGELSIVDYPGFEHSQAPDLETYSKALNGGQYPLSVLAMTERAAGLYRTGIYGNTMTANPKAMDVGDVVLGSLTPELRTNIRARGVEFLERFRALAKQLNGPITNVQGTGLLLSVELSNDFKCYGAGSIEEWLRLHGIGVIHGGRNSLRFTPHFGITSAEIALVVDAVGHALQHGPRVSTSVPANTTA